MTSMRLLLGRQVDFEDVKRGVAEEYSAALGEAFVPDPSIRVFPPDKR
jgi:hypothetical protein